MDPSGEPLLYSMLDMELGPQPPHIPKEGISTFELWQVHQRRLELRKEYLDRWQTTAATTSTGRPVDAILCPAACGASIFHGMNK
jgi:amidase